MKDVPRNLTESRYKKGKHDGKGRHQGAQTFRRGRALDFLERLKVKQRTLRDQLEAPEFQEIKPVILGELKAVEMIIEEYTKHFDIQEVGKGDSMPEFTRRERGEGTDHIE